MATIIRRGGNTIRAASRKCYPRQLGMSLYSLAGGIRCCARERGSKLKHIRWFVTDATLIAFTFGLLFFEDAKHLFCILLMTSLWILDTLPLAVTASLPLVVQPLLGIADCHQVAAWFMSPRFVWLLCLHLASSVVDTSALTLMAASRVVELFGGSFRSLLAVIVLFTFEMTLFVDEALCVLLLWPLAEAVVRHMQFFQGTPASTPGPAAFATEDVPASPEVLKEHTRSPPSERLGTRVHVNPTIPESSSYSTTNMARFIVTQHSSMGPTSSLELVESVSPVPAAELTADGKCEARQVQAECNRAVPIDSSRMEAIFRMWDANAAQGKPQAFPSSQPFPSSTEPESTTVEASFALTRTGLVPVLNPDNPPAPGRQIIPTIPGVDLLTSHSVAEELATSINEKLFRMKVGLKISIAYASTFGSFGTPYGTSLALAAQAYFKEHLNSIGLGQWIVLCLPIAALTVTSCTCLVFWLFMGEWELDDIGLELASFLKNVVELKISEDKSREIRALITVSAVIVLLGCSAGALVTFLDIESTEINCCTYVLLLVLGMSAVSHLRDARGGNTPLVTGAGGAEIGRGGIGGGGVAGGGVVGVASSTLGLEAGIVRAPWAMLFLLGGHNCLGKVAESSGVVDTMHAFLRQLSSYKPIFVQAVLVAWSSLLSEVWSSVEAHRALLGVVKELAVEMQVNPVYYTFPVTIAISTAGMLPGSALSITLLMDKVRLSTVKLLVLGAASKLVAVVCTLVSMNTVAMMLYDFSNTSYPLGHDNVMYLPLQSDSQSLL